MGYHKGIVRVWIDEGEQIGGGPVFPPEYPSHPIYRPPYPDQGLPPYPDNSLPGWQPRPDQGLPPYPDQGLPGQPPRPDQGLPPFAQPMAYDVGDEPTEPPTDGTWVVAVYGNSATWVFVPTAAEPPEVEHHE